MKRKVAAYTILSGIMTCGLFIFLHVAEVRTFNLWDFVGALLLSPVAGLSVWFRYDWSQQKLRETIEKVERDWNEP